MLMDELWLHQSPMYWWLKIQMFVPSCRPVCSTASWIKHNINHACSDFTEYTWVLNPLSALFFLCSFSINNHSSPLSLKEVSQNFSHFLTLHPVISISQCHPYLSSLPLFSSGPPPLCFAIAVTSESWFLLHVSLPPVYPLYCSQREFSQLFAMWFFYLKLLTVFPVPLG